MKLLGAAGACLLGLTMLCLPPRAAAVWVDDDHGVRTEFASAPQRIVSLLPSLTETVCALGECRRLVGVDRDSNHPGEVLRLPRVGGGLDPDVEAIVALHPDVVLASSSTQVRDRLQSLGLKVVALEPRTYADVQHTLLAIGKLLQVADPQRAWRAIEAGVAAAARSVPPSARGARVYFEVNQGPYAAGEASFIGETLARLGARNIVPTALGPFPALNPEFVVRADPDVVMVAEGSAGDLDQRPGWSHIRALREKRECVFNPGQSDLLVRAGPRLAEAAWLMADCLAGRTAAPLASGRAR